MSDVLLEKQATPGSGIAVAEGLVYLNSAGLLCYMLSDLIERSIFYVPTAALIHASPAWVKVGNALPYTDFQTAATTKSNVLFSLVAGGIITGIKIKHSTAFAGGVISALTIEVGISGNTSSYAQAFDVFQAVGAGTMRLSNTMGSESHTGATDILITATSTGANLSALTAGVVDVWALLSKAI